MTEFMKKNNRTIFQRTAINFDELKKIFKHENPQAHQNLHLSKDLVIFKIHFCL